ncbi:filamentous hemagglutinin N-terminal domain-containing protein [Candidatus Halobeggiatoa sp. HSG11]|nr:filamentous hemagglutinin N-terminal domain-containing protein [Candidatus Halobeggiatoa sp. HSG11]
MKYLITIPLLVTSLSINAEVITDGTLGQNINLPGPDFQIEADLGQQHGGNLFHSFQDFNLNSSESATFSGPNSVQNIISRVTGGNPSNIDGLLRSTIPNANFYFLNPYGIMFGPNAQLDIQGSFHASTADYLRLGENGRFDVRNPSDSLLTIAPIEAFGFLGDSPAPITTQDSTLLVPPFKSLSLIGGDLQLQGTLPIQFDDLNIYATFATSFLKTTGGTLNLTAIGSSGEVIVSNNDLTITGQGGDISLNRTLVDTSSLGSGNLKIRGGWLQMQDSALQTNTLGDFDGGLMDIQLTELLYATSDPNHLGLQSFSSKAFGSGHGGSITIKVPKLVLDRVAISANPMAETIGGNTDIEVAQLSLLNGAGISNASVGGKSGLLTIKATESILISGYGVGSGIRNGVPFIDLPSYIDSTTYSSGLGGNIDINTQQLDMVGGIITSASFSVGNAANIHIQANNINLTAGAFIATSAADLGLAGSIQLDVADTLFLSGRRDGIIFLPSTNQEVNHNTSSIQSLSLLGTGGQLKLKAKTIHLTEEGSITASSLGLGEKISTIDLQTENLILTEGGQINASNSIYDISTSEMLIGVGHGGGINIRSKYISLTTQHSQANQTGIFTDTYTHGLGGNINLQTDFLDIKGDSAISARAYGIGDAGQINLQAQQIQLTENANISTASTLSGGGNIELTNLSRLLYLNNSEITTSVAKGVGSGGNITIKNPNFVVLNQGKIKTQADAGHGGNISIKSEQFITSPNSLISASSNLGLDGEVAIESIDVDLDGFLVVLPDKVVDASNQMKTPCGQRITENMSSFVVIPSEGSPNSLDDLLPSGPLLSEILPIKTTVSVKNSTEKLASLTCKK